MGLRLKLKVRAPELAALPWELLYDPAHGEFVSLSRATPIVRYIDLPRAPKALAITPPLRVLGMVSSPSDLPVLNDEREKRRVEEALKGLSTVEVTWVRGGRGGISSRR